MEVHHPDLHHKKKHFREYFLEFLMIFLAVTMGFIAENLREHFTERSKERQYITSFIRNVKDDTANMREVISFGRHQLTGIGWKKAKRDFTAQDFYANHLDFCGYPIIRQ